MKKNTLLLILFIVYINHLSAQKTPSVILGGCDPATASADLDINNVRAKILNAGDMWWDLVKRPCYEVPKGSGKASLFAGSLWIGGLDVGGSLKIASMMYRQTGNDFWPGPLSSTAETDASTCNQYDKLWKINKEDVVKYYNWVTGPQIDPNPVSPSVMNVINSWPTTGKDGHSLAPFLDLNGDGNYDYLEGDVPKFDILDQKLCGNVLYGDQSIFWVFNDAGNTHSETKGTAMGIEVQAQAFAYSTADDLNNTTFYKYTIVNRSSFSIQNTYIGLFTDPQLGDSSDNYSGCDVARNMGYTYNFEAGDKVYGINAAAIGIDLLEGPYADPDGLDNDANTTFNGSNYGNGITDDERLGMSYFMYWHNDFTVTGNPSTSTHFYNYLHSTWKDGAVLTYGDDGRTGTQPCRYMFPGDSDPIGWGVGGTPTSPKPQSIWTEEGTPQFPITEHRLTQSMGPFTFQPGAVQTITFAVVWAQASSGGPKASLQKMLNASDEVQKLFDACFVNISIGINKNNKNSLIVNVSPNPFTTYTTLTFENTKGEKYELNVYNVLGQLVLSKSDITGNNVVIERNQLLPGDYFYTLQNSKKEVVSGKLALH